MRTRDGLTQALSALAVAAVAMLLAWLFLGASSRFEPPLRDGAMVLVQADAGPRLWVATVQEEVRTQRVADRRFSLGRMVTNAWYHLRVQAHDAHSTQRLWLTTLKLVKDDDGGRNAQVRLLGQNGSVVWLWVHDQLLALSPEDGEILADRERLEAANPALHGLFSAELTHYTWIDELVTTLADGRHVRIDPGDYRASDYVIADEAQFRRANVNGHGWNGGYRTHEFGIRHGIFGEHWTGLFSDTEARDAEDDPWGEHYADAARVRDEGASARRGFWRASTGRTRQFSEGRHERIVRLDRIDGAGTYLQGRLLKAQAAPGTPEYVLRGNHWRPTPGLPLPLSDPPGMLVLHRTRMDAQGRLALTRLDERFSERWTTALPLAELGNRWQLDSHLLLFGHWDPSRPGGGRHHEALVALDLATGDWRGWQIDAEAALDPP